MTEFADRIYHVHVKDSIKRLDGRRSILGGHLNFGEEARGWDFVSPGHGDVDFEALIRVLNRIGYHGPLSIEWEDSGMDRDWGAPDALAFVRAPTSRRPRWRSTPRSSAHRIAIAGGAGGVGSSLAYSLLLRPEPFDVRVIDRRPAKVASHVMDLELVPSLGWVVAGGWDDLGDVDVLVICAATALTASTSRAVYLAANAEIVDAIAARLGGWDGVVVMVTNPVDPLVAGVAARSGIAGEQLG